MRNYLVAFYKSLYDFKWLGQQKKSFKKGFIYFLLFMALMALEMIIQFGMIVPAGVKEAKNIFKNDVPDFTLLATGGFLKVDGLEQPYIYRSGNEDKNNFVFVVDTIPSSTTNLSVRDYMGESDTDGVLLKRDEFQIYNAKEGKTEIQSFEGLPDFQSSKTDMINFLDKWSTLAIWGLIILGSLFVTFFWGLGKLIYLFLISGVVFVVSSIAAKQWRYREIYVVGLYAVTLPTILLIILDLIPLRINFFYTAALLLFMIAPLFVKVKAESDKKDEKDK